MSSALKESNLCSLPLLGRGKVRDIYAVDDKRLLIVQSDRISAFDVVMNETIPGKGVVLTDMSHFWFSRLSGVANHISNEAPEAVVAADECERIAGRAMLVKRFTPLPIEAVCRGYLIGSGWKDYQQTGTVCGITLPPGLRLAEKLPEVIFTPATKAQHGEHDENISFAQMADIIGTEEAETVRDASFMIYQQAAQYAESKGVIIADTKFEFAFDDDEKLILIDEVLTPDSSRFWPADSWRVGENPQSFDKQPLRDWLEEQPWNKKHPPPTIPADVIDATTKRYLDIRERLLGKEKN